MLRSTYKKCDRSQRQNSLPPNVKYEMHSVPVSSDLMKQVDLCLCVFVSLSWMATTIFLPALIISLNGWRPNQSQIRQFNNFTVAVDNEKP